MRRQERFAPEIAIDLIYRTTPTFSFFLQPSDFWLSKLFIADHFDKLKTIWT